MASDTKNSTRNTEELQAQIEAVKDDIAAIGATLADLVQSGVREGRAKAERTAEEYKKKGKQKADAAMNEALVYSDALESKIVHNPFAAVLMALGLGFLVGLMSRR